MAEPVQISFKSALKQAFDNLIVKEYGVYEAPPSFVTSTGIKTLDAVLGGGLSSSLPVMFTSTPETGKSTIAFQMAKQFQTSYEDSIVVYLDVESAANSNKDSEVTSRINSFGISSENFIYKPYQLTLDNVFKFFDNLIDIATEAKKKSGRDPKLLFIWDSIASTPSSKDESAEDVNDVIGYKARELSFLLTKYKSKFVMSSVTLIFVDQIRSNIKISKSPFAPRDEKSTGEFGNVKAASNIAALQHNICQWLYFSKLSTLSQADPLGVDGWVLNIYTEKNKIAPSKVSIDVVFDKKYGIVPLASEYYFLSEMTKYEVKLTGNKKEKLIYPLSVVNVDKSKIIQVVDISTGEIVEKTDKFMERNLVKLYNTDSNFKRIFDLAVDTSVKYRIKQAIHRIDHDEEANQ